MRNAEESVDDTEIRQALLEKQSGPLWWRTLVHGALLAFAIASICVALPVAILTGQLVTGAPPESPEAEYFLPRGYPLWFLVFWAVLWHRLGVPPIARSRWLLSIYYSAIGIALLLPSPCPPWTLSVVGAVVGLLLGVLECIRITCRNFRELQELYVANYHTTLDNLARLLFWHISDIHVTDGPGIARIERGKGSGGLKALPYFLNLCKTRTARFIIISGDVTDSGTEAQWNYFETILQSASLPDNSKVIIAPGNHDLSEQYSSVPRRNRSRRYIETLARLCPEMKTCSGQTLGGVSTDAQASVEGPLVQAIVKAMSQELCGKMLNSRRYTRLSAEVQKSCLESYSNEQLQALARDELIDAWFETKIDTLFPLKLHDQESDSLVIILNSVMGHWTIGESGLGSLGDEQLNNLKEILADIPHGIRNAIVVTHHPPVRRPHEWRMFTSLVRPRDYLFLTHSPGESRKLTNLLVGAADKNQETKFFLLCGHRHPAQSGWVGKVRVLEAGEFACQTPEAWALSANGNIEVCLTRVQVG